MKLRSEPLRGESALNMRVLVGRSFGDPHMPTKTTTSVTDHPHLRSVSASTSTMRTLKSRHPLMEASQSTAYTGSSWRGDREYMGPMR